MNARLRTLIENFVHNNIDAFHARRLSNIQGLTLKGVLENKNPYLFKAKNLNSASELVSALLDARLSSGEETTFGKFLEDLALFVAQKTGGGQKSTTQGLDIDLTRNGVRYLIALKSGPNWGNADQHKKLRELLRTAVRVARQSGVQTGAIVPVEGICYGKFGRGAGKEDKGDYIRLAGQSFWHLISGQKTFYVDVIEPLAHEAKAHAEKFQAQKDATYNRLIREFTIDFCDQEGNIDWHKLVRYVSENMLPEVHLAMPAGVRRIEQEAAKKSRRIRR